MAWRKNFTKVFLFGDSLTQQSFSPGGWGARLADHFQRIADIFNRGFSGYNSEWAKLILPDLLTSSDQADYVTVFFGANDAAIYNANPHQHVPLATFKSNLVEMCTYLELIKIPKSSIILITPPPLCDHMWKATCKEWGITYDRYNEVTKQYADATLQVGQELGVTAVDLHGIMSQETDNMEQYFSDGVHFSGDGNKFLAQLLLPILRSKIDEEAYVFPNWAAVNSKCPKESFRRSLL